MRSGWRTWGTAFIALTVLGGAGSGPLLGSDPPPAAKVEPLPRRVEPNPHQAVRMLAALQERIADGSSEALATMGDLSREIGKRLAAFDASVWDDARYREVLLKYVLSGGEPGLVKELIARKKFKEEERRLARGVVAYVYGDRPQAASALAGIDPRGLSPSLGGHVALLTAVLLADENPRRALELCNESRLLSPGTLVEEAALRLTIELAITTGDLATFKAAVMRHMRRFPNSLYSRVIDLRIARVLAAHRYNAAGDARLLSVLSNPHLPIERRQFLFSELADAGLRAANKEMAGIGARYLRAVVTSSSPAMAKSKAIEAAVAVLTRKSSQADKLIDETVAAKPEKDVLALLGELETLSAIINAPPQKIDLNAESVREVQDPSPPMPSDQVGSIRDTTIAARIEETIVKAEAKFSTVEKLLSEAGS